MHNTPNKPGKTSPVLAEGREVCDVGRKVLVTSVGGPVEGCDFQKLKYRNKDSEGNQSLVGQGRSVRGETGVVVKGPYHIHFKAKTKQRTASGRIAKDKYGKIRMKDEWYVTEPYWMVRLDANRIYLHVSESEMRFLG